VEYKPLTFSDGRQATHRSPRRRVRLRVVTPRGTSLTVNVSPGGFCTGLMRVLPVNERIVGTIHFEGRDEPFAGRVVWARAGNSRLNLMGAMGVCFETIAFDFARDLSGREAEPGQ